MYRTSQEVTIETMPIMMVILIYFLILMRHHMILSNGRFILTLTRCNPNYLIHQLTILLFMPTLLFGILITGTAINLAKV